MTRKTISIILLFFGLNIFSQNKNEYFIDAGYSQASQSPLSYSFFQTSYWRQNIHNGFFGIEYYRNINKKNAIGIGLQAVEKGFRIAYVVVSIPQYELDQRYFFKQNYFEMPIMYRYSTKRYFFSVGFLASYLVKSSQGSAFIRRYYNGGIQDSRNTSYNSAEFKKFDAGIIFRIGMELRKNLFATATFTRGFIRPYIYQSGELNYNEVFMFGLSYKLK